MTSAPKHPANWLQRNLTLSTRKAGYTPSTHGSIERETHGVIERFLRHELDFPASIAALDGALADLIPRLTVGQIARLRIVMLANNEIVLKEIERRAASVKDISN